MGGALSKTRSLRWDALRLPAVCIFDFKLLLLMLIILAWGDADALAEAGFCYAQGVGCKKDLKKSAKFYRQAEAKGISMIGNSWYVLIASNCSVRLTVN
jgi:TPR repeat protein